MSEGYIIFFLLILILGGVVNIKLNYKYKILVYIFILSLGVIALSFKPTQSLDAYRIERYFETINNRGNNIFEILFGTKGDLAGTSMTGMVSFNLLCFIVKCLGNIKWMWFISVTVTVGIILIVLLDYMICEQYSSRAYSLGVYLSFIGLQIQYVFSGVRNSLAVALTIMAFYLYFYKRKGYFVPVVLYFLAITMHPFVGIVLPALLISKLPLQKLFRILALFTAPAVFILPAVLNLIPLPFTKYVSNRIIFYQYTQYEFDRPEMIANILIFISVGLAFWIFKKNKLIDLKSRLEKDYTNAYYLLGYSMLGCSVHRDLALRIGYFMGVASVPIVCWIFFRNKKPIQDSRLVQYVLVFVIIACGLKVYYDTFLVMSKWTFVN